MFETFPYMSVGACLYWHCFQFLGESIQPERIRSSVFLQVGALPCPSGVVTRPRAIRLVNMIHMLHLTKSNNIKVIETFHRPKVARWTFFSHAKKSTSGGWTEQAQWGPVPYTERRRNITHDMRSHVGHPTNLSSDSTKRMVRCVTDGRFVRPSECEERIVGDYTQRSAVLYLAAKRGLVLLRLEMQRAKIEVFNVLFLEQSIGLCV